MAHRDSSGLMWRTYFQANTQSQWTCPSFCAQLSGVGGHARSNAYQAWLQVHWETSKATLFGLSTHSSQGSHKLQKESKQCVRAAGSPRL